MTTEKVQFDSALLGDTSGLEEETAAKSGSDLDRVELDLLDLSEFDEEPEEETAPEPEPEPEEKEVPAGLIPRIMANPLAKILISGAVVLLVTLVLVIGGNMAWNSYKKSTRTQHKKVRTPVAQLPVSEQRELTELELTFWQAVKKAAKEQIHAEIPLLSSSAPVYQEELPEWVNGYSSAKRQLNKTLYDARLAEVERQAHFIQLQHPTIAPGLEEGDTHPLPETRSERIIVTTPPPPREPDFH